jgi:uncharacterized protein (TIGR02217 family)
MTFLETPRFPTTLRFGLTGGPEYSTSIAEMNNGWEQRNENWTEARGSWSAEYGPHSSTDTAALVSMFRSVKGASNPFRFKDPSDHTVTISNGTLGAWPNEGKGTGYPTYQLYKQYVSGALSEARPIRKPVSGAVTVYRNATPCTVGVAHGNISINTVTGVITFISDASAYATSLTLGATTHIFFASNMGLTYGQRIHLGGFTGADAGLLNSLAHVIISITGSGPYDFLIDTNTAGKSITLGSGGGAKYPQTTDALTWAGEFDVPVRFATDKLDIKALEGGWFSWDNVGLVEVRT